jgi:hypothetical protein
MTPSAIEPAKVYEYGVTIITFGSKKKYMAGSWRHR